MSSQPVYLDNQATTPVDLRVVAAMQPYFTQQFGNPHSGGHAYGWMAADAVEKARNKVATLIGADAREVIFTSGATESCNLAVRGLCRAAMRNFDKQESGRQKIVTITTEHPCVLETCEDMRQEGYEVVVLGVQPDGLVDLDQIRKAVDEKTLLVTVMTANNEIGVLQPIAEIAEICQAQGAYLHTDATQAMGKIPVNVNELNVDLLSLSGHKMYGPMGVGALYIRWDSAVKIQPIVTGGGQEGGLRAGTVPVPLIVGLGEACQLAGEELEKDMKWIKHLTTRLWESLFQTFPEVALYGHPDKRVPGNINIGFPGYSGDEIVELVCDHLAISTGSACSSTKTDPSHVLVALGIGVGAAQSGIRLSVGKFNTEEDIEQTIGILSDTIETTLNRRAVNEG